MNKDALSSIARGSYPAKIKGKSQESKDARTPF